MQTMDDAKAFVESSIDTLTRSFEILHLLALPRKQIRQVVSAYNEIKKIGDEDVLLSKIISDLENLNIHRTPLNCLTLLKVSEKHFDESPVNRTKMIEMVLFVLFNTDDLPTYKAKPDLKDCEYVLGYFCEQMRRNNKYSFSLQDFSTELKTFCTNKLIDLEIDIVFDVLFANNIIIKRDDNYVFRSTYWIFYFAAQRMHQDEVFANYILNDKKYTSFPEIIEFYTGIDRSRENALKIMIADIKETCEIVRAKVGLPENMNPFKMMSWNPVEKDIVKMQDEIGEDVIKSRLPDSVKDEYADRNYNQIKPYNQDIKNILKEYSLLMLMQNIRAASKALRNSDYVRSEIKQEILNEILKSWEQISQVLLVLAPILAKQGQVSFEGAGFHLSNDFAEIYEDKLNEIIQANPLNIILLFKDDLFSSKLGPLLYNHIAKEENELIKHKLILLLIYERPRNWKKYVEEYIIANSKKSFFLFNVVNNLSEQYRYAFVNHATLKDIEYLIKMGLAKHEFGDKKPGLHNILKISSKNLPKREISGGEEDK